MIKYNFNDVKNIVHGKNGTLLSHINEYKNTHSVIHIKCNKCGHVWKTPFYRINTNNTWCIKCSGKLKYTIDEVRKIINEKGGTLLSKEYKNSNTKLKIKCNKCKWIWEPKFMHIMNSKSWCPSCAGNPRYSIDHVRGFIEKNNGLLLSSSYKNSKSKLKVKCNKCNTLWSSNWDRLQQGKWCPLCSIGKTQKKLTKIIKDLYPNCSVFTNYKKFDWLKNKKDPRGVLEIDIFIKDENNEFSLGIEYDGRQHYESVCFGGMTIDQAKKEFEKQKERDKRKNYLIENYKNDIQYFVRFNYKENITLELVCQKLKKIGAI